MNNFFKFALLYIFILLPLNLFIEYASNHGQLTWMQALKAGTTSFIVWGVVVLINKQQIKRGTKSSSS